MADVATRAGVSKSTVSAVLNDKDIVKASTRRRVLKAVDELNYRPQRPAGRSARSRTGGSIGFVIKEAGNPYYAEALAGIQEVASEAGYLVFVSSSEGDVETEKQIVEQFSSCDFDGLIITPILHDDADLSHIFDLKRLNMPLILLENVRGVRAGLVDTDNVEASAQAVKHLIKLGHTRIVHFAGPAYLQHSDERVEGVRRAFSESRLIFDSDTVVVPTGDSIAAGYEVGLEYFSKRDAEHPTGVTCYNDLVALGLLKVLRELGLQVPEDVSIIGFDDLDILSYLPLPLTTVRVPKREMGRKAAELLIQQIDGKQDVSRERLYLEAELVVRASTRAVDGDSTGDPTRIDGKASSASSADEQSSSDGTTSAGSRAAGPEPQRHP